MLAPITFLMTTYIKHFRLTFGLASKPTYSDTTFCLTITFTSEGGLDVSLFTTAISASSVICQQTNLLIAQLNIT